MADLLSRARRASPTTKTCCCPGYLRASCVPVVKPAKALGLATPNMALLTDMIACPGGDFCALANARSLPIAEAITQRYQDLDELDDIGEIDLHISGCINSCGHHHSGHIGILGVDKDGKEWYQVTLGGSDGSTLSGEAGAGQGDRPLVLGRRSARRAGSRADDLPRPAPARRAFIDAAAPHRPGPFQGSRQRRAPPAPAEVEAEAM